MRDAFIGESQVASMKDSGTNTMVIKNGDARSDRSQRWVGRAGIAKELMLMVTFTIMVLSLGRNKSMSYAGVCRISVTPPFSESGVVGHDIGAIK